MQSLLRLVNAIAGPLLTLFLVVRLSHGSSMDAEAVKALAAAIAPTTVLVIELSLTRGPKRSRFFRRWQC